MGLVQESSEVVQGLRPYFEEGGIRIYHARCEDVDWPKNALVVTDPPYGIGYRSGHNSGYSKDDPRYKEWGQCRRTENFAPIEGDDTPFNPFLLVHYPAAIFGGNFFADKLPVSRCWIVWDKNCGKTRSSQADCELVWTNFDRPSRVFSHLWRGICRAGEENVSREHKYHPNQKPRALLRYIIEYSQCDLSVFDPYMGSGSTLVASLDLGRSAIGIECEELYCEIAADRVLEAMKR